MRLYYNSSRGVFMITIKIYGLDQFVVGRFSREITSQLAKLYELEEDDINFVAPENMVFHNGVEQTSWNTIIEVYAPKRASLVQEEVANFLSVSLGDYAINVIIEFYYYDEANRYVRLNKKYPRYITDENIVNTEQEYDEYDDEEEDEECECGHHHHHHHEEPSEEELYTGDIFKDFNNK